MATKSDRTTSKRAATDRPGAASAPGGPDRLRTYRSKRDFSVTPEPRGDAGSGGHSTLPATATARFVVQRHRASSLHYDFRLEVDGALASWAVPRGPTLDPSQRRLAVRVEDHPLGYFDFEGVIPAHEYGAGDVIVWDWGTYRADPETPDPARAIDDGEFKFELDGDKLAGAFVLVRTAGFGRQRARPDGSRAKWLLIHRRDAAAVPGWDAEDEPCSVKTGRTNDEVAAGRRGRRTARCLQRPPESPRAGRALVPSTVRGTTQTRPAKEAPPVDAIAMLKEDHDKVKRLLAELEPTTERGVKTRTELFATIKGELTVHELIEEEIFYPELRAHPKARDIVLEGYQEHHVVDLLMGELESLDVTDETWGAKAVVMKENVEHHIEEEEGEMFPKARQVFDRAELAELGERMATRKTSAKAELNIP